MASTQREGQDNREIIHHNDICVGCGICSDICPTSALNLGPILPIARGIVDMDYIRMDEHKCVVCGLCSFACPFNAMEFKINGNVAKNLNEYPKWDHGTNIDKEDCILCGKCEIYCPRDAILVKRELPKIKNLVSGEIKTDVDKCITCHICEEMCPADAITIKTTSNSAMGRFEASNIEIDPEKCMYCKICQKVCPEDAIKAICTTCMDSENIPEVEITGDVVLDEISCINCSWCEKICPSDAAHTIKPFKGEVLLQENEEEEKVCTGEACHACLDVCPCNAITLTDNHMSVNSDVCVLCGACEKACPQKILSVDRSSMELSNIKSKSWQNILGSLIE